MSLAPKAALQYPLFDRVGQGKRSHHTSQCKEKNKKKSALKRSLGIEILISLQVFASNKDFPDPSLKLPPKSTTLPFSGKKPFKSPGLNKQKTQSACRLNLKQMVKLLQK